MVEIVKFASKSEKDAEAARKFKENALNDYYNSMSNLKDSIDTVLTLIVNNEGHLIVVSNDMDAKSALWTVEEFKMNCLFGTFTEEI